MTITLPSEIFTSLKADIDIGLADVATGRLREFDTARIIEHGRQLLARDS
jgi:antitoxin ParD1/3/4